MRYFIGKNGQQLGPFEEPVIRGQLASGALSYDDLIWREGMNGWAPIHTILPPLDDKAHSEPPPVAPYQHHREGNPFVSSPAAPARELLSPPALADRGKRLVAVILDGLLALAVASVGLVMLIVRFTALEQQGGDNISPETLILELAAPLLIFLVPLLILTVIQVTLLCKHGQSLGKRWMRVRIVRTDGSPVGFVHAILLRSFVLQLVGAIPLVGGLVNLVDPLLIFREDRRCLHDLIADTRVVKAD
jgi:uncharacterized RDD family membrane protein YckC